LADSAPNINRPAKIAAVPRAINSNDLPSLTKFLVGAYKSDPSNPRFGAEVQAWKYLAPGPAWTGPRSYLLEKEGQIVAYCGISPATFQLPNGSAVSSLTMMDWAADPSSPAIGVVLFRKLMGMAPTSFVIGGAPAVRKMIPHFGFGNMGEALTYAAWLRPWREFRQRPLTQKSMLRLGHGLLHPARPLNPGGWEAVPVNEFDDSILPILTIPKRPWTFCRRTLADLNYWLKCPCLKMQGFLLRRKGQLVGYFILGRAEWEARLLDLAIDSADASDWNLACAVVTRTARLDPQACRIRALATAPVLAQALLKNGYWRQGQEPIGVYDPKNALEGAFPVDFQLFVSDSGY
jgi:hypothetical protein